MYDTVSWMHASETDLVFLDRIETRAGELLAVEWRFLTTHQMHVAIIDTSTDGSRDRCMRGAHQWDTRRLWTAQGYEGEDARRQHVALTKNVTSQHS